MLAKLIPWAKMIPAILILLLVATIAVQTNRLKHANQQIANEREQRAVLAKAIGAEDNWLSINVHARDLKQSAVNLMTTLTRISTESLENKKRADAADAALVREQADNAKRFAQSQLVIQKIEQQKSTGNQTLDDQIIDEMSKLPWLGWRKAPQLQAVPADWQEPELRADYNSMMVPLLYQQRPIRLVLYSNIEKLRQAFADMNPDYKLKPGLFIEAFSEIDRPDNICVIHIVDPKVKWNSEVRNVLGHETAHCFYGAWHEEARA